MNYLSKVLFAILLSVCAYNSAEAVTIDDETFCQLTILKSDRNTFKILVPREKVKSMYKQFDVVGINCRNQSF